MSDSRFSNVEKQAMQDSANMLDLTRVGEKSAELMFSEVYADLQNNQGLKGKDLENSLNRYINTINTSADKLADSKGEPYNLKFEIVDTNKDGKWNQGEEIRVHNESRYFFSQPASFKADGPGYANSFDALLKERAQLKREGI